MMLDDWDAQMLFFLHHGYRVIAHDRRGHRRSAQVSEGNDACAFQWRAGTGDGVDVKIRYGP
jgi:pimeloyl-ACP methyl ester carboxylesterase